MLHAPLLEESAVTKGDVIRGIDAETQGCAINPLGGAFEFRKVADGCFIDDAVALAVGPLGAPFFITKRRNESKTKEKLCERIAVRDAGLGFNAVLVSVLGRDVRTGKALMRERPAARVATDAENLGAGAHLAIGRVVEGICLEAARSFQAKTRGFEALLKCSEVGDTEFDLGFESHAYKRV